MAEHRVTYMNVSPYLPLHLGSGSTYLPTVGWCWPAVAVAWVATD